MNDIYEEIVLAVTEYKFDLLKDYKKSLSKEIESMDIFFEEFLTNKQLDRRKTTVTNWATYREKTEEYSVIVENLKLVDYYLEKYNV